jgi:hypothetical protein
MTPEFIDLNKGVLPFCFDQSEKKRIKKMEDAPVGVDPGDAPARNHIEVPRFRAAGVFKTLPGMEG